MSVNLKDLFHKIMDGAEAEARRVFGNEAGELTADGKDLLATIRSQGVAAVAAAESEAGQDLKVAEGDAAQALGAVAQNAAQDAGGTGSAGQPAEGGAVPQVSGQPGAPA